MAHLATAAARGMKLVVARGPDAEAEEEAKAVVAEDMPVAVRDAFVFVSDRWHEGQVIAC